MRVPFIVKHRSTSDKNTFEIQVDLYNELILLNSSNNSRIYKKWHDNL